MDGSPESYVLRAHRADDMDWVVRPDGKQCKTTTNKKYRDPPLRSG